MSGGRKSGTMPRVLSARAHARPVRVGDGDVAAAARPVSWRRDAVAVRRRQESGLVHQIHQVVRLGERVRPDLLHPRLSEEAQGAAQRGGSQDRRRPHLPVAGAGRASELDGHVELAGLVRPPPAGQRGGLTPMTPVDVEGADRAGAAVEILVGAPDGPVDAPFVEPVGTAPTEWAQSNPATIPVAERSAPAARCPAVGRGIEHRGKDDEGTSSVSATSMSASSIVRPF
jgi:hypothetical protein